MTPGEPTLELAAVAGGPTVAGKLRGAVNEAVVAALKAATRAWAPRPWDAAALVVVALLPGDDDGGAMVALAHVSSLLPTPPTCPAVLAGPPREGPAAVKGADWPARRAARPDLSAVPPGVEPLLLASHLPGRAGPVIVEGAVTTTLALVCPREAAAAVPPDDAAAVAWVRRLFAAAIAGGSAAGSAADHGHGRGCMCTPPLVLCVTRVSEGALPGVARARALAAAPGVGLAVLLEAPPTRLWGCVAMAAVNAARGVRTLSEVRESETTAVVWRPPTGVAGARGAKALAALAAALSDPPAPSAVPLARRTLLPAPSYRSH